MFATAGSHTYYSLQEDRNCSVNYFSCGALLIFMGAILFCALGFIVILPYASTRDWQETKCNVTLASVNESICACELEIVSVPTCVERYPCLQIYVSHRFLRQPQRPNVPVNDSRYGTTQNDTNDNLAGAGAFAGAFSPHYMDNEQETPSQSSTVKTATQKHEDDVTTFHKSVTKTRPVKQDYVLSTEKETDDNDRSRHRHNHQLEKRTSKVKHEYSTFGDTRHYVANVYGYGAPYHTMLYRSWKDIYYSHCTLNECGDRDWNTKTTQQFAQNYGKRGETFSCFVNPRDPHTVIAEKTPFSYMVHAVIWPSICLFIGFTLWLGLCCGCWALAPDREPTDYYS